MSSSIHRQYEAQHDCIDIYHAQHQPVQIGATHYSRNRNGCNNLAPCVNDDYSPRHATHEVDGWESETLVSTVYGLLSIGTADGAPIDGKRAEEIYSP